MFYIIRTTILLYLLSTSLVMSHSKKKSLESHVHGVGTLNIAQDGNNLLFEFEIPGNDIVGFEYEAKEEDDINKVKNALDILSDHKNMILPSGAGKCQIESYTANVINEGKHSEFLSNYKFNCENISELKLVYIKYFKNFENGKKLNIKIYGQNKKSIFVIDKAKKFISVKNHF